MAEEWREAVDGRMVVLDRRMVDRNRDIVIGVLLLFGSEFVA